MQNQTIIVKTGAVYQKIPLDKILFCEAKGAYTRIVTETEELTVAKNLKYFEKELQQSLFFRVSRSHLINLHHCTSIICGARYAVLSSLHKIEISVRQLPKAIRAFKRSLV